MMGQKCCGTCRWHRSNKAEDWCEFPLPFWALAWLTRTGGYEASLVNYDDGKDCPTYAPQEAKEIRAAVGTDQTSDMLAEIQKTSCMAHQPDTAHALLAEIVAMYGEAYPSSTIDRARRLLKDYGGQ
jgi:hypothetical protein